jgi:hypothetical protein
MRKNLCLVLALLASAPLASAQRGAAAPEGPPPAIAARTANMTNMPGLLPLHWDATAGKLYLEIPLNAQGKSIDVLYTNSLPYGTGSNDLGLDRGQTAGGKIVHFERVGPKVLLIEPNEAFRTSSTDPHQQLALHQSFPSSVLGGFTVAAASPDAVMVDATDFFLRDVHGVTEILTRMNQGAFRVDPTRSTIDLESTKAFPKNTEVDAMLTFVNEGGAAGGRGGGGGGGGRGGNYVSEVSPERRAALTRAPATSRRATVTTTPRSATISTSSSSSAIASSRRIPTARNPARLSRPSSITSTTARRLRFAWLCSKARAGGIRHSRPQAGRPEPSKPTSCPTAPTPWTSATTSSSGCTVTPAAGATAPPSATRARARSSKAT